MNSTEYEQQNMTLRAGNNSNTIGLPVALAANKEMPGTVFYVSKWVQTDQEREVYHHRVTDIIHAYLNSEVSPEVKLMLIKKLVEIVPPVFLAAMGAPTPVMVLANNPFEEGWMTPMDEEAKRLTKPNSRPEEN